MSAHNSDNENSQNVPVREGSDNEMEVNPDDDSRNSMGNAASRILDLNLDSPVPTAVSSSSTSSTAGTDKTSTIVSISPEGASVTSAESAESKDTESEGINPLDDQQMVDAILKHKSEAKTPQVPSVVSENVDSGSVLSRGSSSTSSNGSTSESKSSDPTQVTALVAGPNIDADSTQIKDVEESEKQTSELKQEGVQSSTAKTQPPPSGQSKLPEGLQASFPVDVQLRPSSESPRNPILGDTQSRSSTSHESLVTVDTQVHPGTDLLHEQSSHCSIRSSEQRDSSESLSDDSHEADVSNLSSMPLEERRRIYSRKNKLRKGSSTSTVSGSLVSDAGDKPKRLHREDTDRSDTQSDVYTLDEDSSRRSSVADFGTSVIFPPGLPYIDPTDRDRRAVSLPAQTVPKVPVTLPERRAKTEPSDDSSSNLDRIPPSDSLDDVSLSLSIEERERRAISLPPVPEGQVLLHPHEQRRASSEVPEHSRSSNLSLSASPVDLLSQSPLVSDPSPVDLLSQSSLVSDPSPVSHQGSDVPYDQSIEETTEESDAPVNGVSHSASTSIASSVAGAVAEGYQGWIAEGVQDDSHLTENLPSTSGVSFNPLTERPTPSPDLSSARESSTSQTSSLSSLSGPTCSDIGGFVPYVLRLAYESQKSSSVQPSRVPGNVGISSGSVPKSVVPEPAKETVQKTSTAQSKQTESGTQVVVGDQMEETDPQASLHQDQTPTSEVQPSLVQESERSLGEQMEGTDPQASLPQDQTPTSEMQPVLVQESEEGSHGERIETKGQTAFEQQPHSSGSLPKITKSVEKTQTPKRKRVPKKKTGEHTHTQPNEPESPYSPASPEEDMATKKKREDGDSDDENPEGKEKKS